MINRNGISAARLSPGYNLLHEVLIRLALLVIYLACEAKEPFVRKIHPDEMWLYRNPRTPSYIPITLLYVSGLTFAAVVFAVHYLRTYDLSDFKCAWLGFTLADTLNGIVTHSIKIAVGRPRPDFFWRCFPDGEMHADMECSGNSGDVNEGRKSFPSGHSSFAFASMTFVSLYLCGKLHVFTERGRGQSWRLIGAAFPMFAATMVAISRTCDYHHHWQDVIAGSVIGFIIGYVCYRQYYPPIDSAVCCFPYTESSRISCSENKESRPSDSQPAGDTRPLINPEKLDEKCT